MDLWIIFLRTVLIYFVIFVILRLMGKREIGKLSIFDLIISVMIAEIAVFVIEDPHRSLMSGLLPMFVLVAIQIALSFIHLKSQKTRLFLEGKPSILIADGQLDEQEMKRQRYNLDDLLQQLREKEIAAISDVAYAILENSGKLSIFKKAGKEAVNRQDMGLAVAEPTPLPLPLIMDGLVQTEHLRRLHKDRKWLVDTLHAQGVTNLEDVFYCAAEHLPSNKLFIQLKKARTDAIGSSTASSE